jgi:pilus assembly protein CpaF
VHRQSEPAGRAGDARPRVYDFGGDAFDARFDTLRAPRRASCSTCRIQWTGWSGASLIGADDILIVAAPDLANLRNAKNMIDLLRAARPNDRRRAYVSTRSACRSGRRSSRRIYYETKSTIFGALIDTIDLSQLAKLDAESAREEIRDIVNEIIALKNDRDVDRRAGGTARGHLQRRARLRSARAAARPRRHRRHHGQRRRPVLHRGRRQGPAHQRPLPRQPAADEHLPAHRQPGRPPRRRIPPICDARLPDGSRVNVIAPPLAIDGPTLTIRKFKKDKLTLDQLVKFGSITPGRDDPEIIGRVALQHRRLRRHRLGQDDAAQLPDRYIDDDERIITCEDAAELQLQQPHVVRLETRPPNLEGEGEITMRDLVKNCLRMRPERIIVGEVRGPEAFDLLQAMNTGHDGSMGTLHANSPREACRVESMITMGGFSLPRAPSAR